MTYVANALKQSSSIFSKGFPATEAEYLDPVARARWERNLALRRDYGQSDLVRYQNQYFPRIPSIDRNTPRPKNIEQLFGTSRWAATDIEIANDLDLLPDENDPDLLHDELDGSVGESHKRLRAERIYEANHFALTSDQLAQELAFDPSDPLYLEWSERQDLNNERNEEIERLQWVQRHHPEIIASGTLPPTFEKWREPLAHTDALDWFKREAKENLTDALALVDGCGFEDEEVASIVAVGELMSAVDIKDYTDYGPCTTAALKVREICARALREAHAPRPAPASPQPRPLAPSSTGVRERAFAETALAGNCSELAALSEGGRNTTLNNVAYRLGRMVARGWLSESEVESALTDACAANGLLKDDGIKQVRATIKSGIRSGVVKPHPDLRDNSSAPERLITLDRNLPPHDPVTGEVIEPSAGLLPITWDGDTQLVFPTCLVKDLITEKSIGFIAGESTAGKTFVAVDLSFAVALGQRFFGKAVKLGGVLYVAAEAPGTIPARMQAARMHRAYPLVVPALGVATDGDLTYQQADHLPIAVLKDVPDLATEKGLAQLIATAKLVGDEMTRRHGLPLRLVQIDTAIAAFGIKDWNNAADVSKVTRALSKIQNATDAAVLAVAHHGKDISKGVAGSFALKANVDTILSVLMTADDDALSGEVKSRHIALTKWRDGPTGWQSAFELASVKIGVNDDGEDVFSAVVAPVKNGTRLAVVKKDKAGRPRDSGRVLRAFKDAFTKALGDHGEPVRVHGDGPQVQAVRRDFVRKAFDARYGVDYEDEKKAADVRRKAFGRGIESAKGWNLHEGTWDGVEWLWKIDAA